MLIWGNAGLAVLMISKFSTFGCQLDDFKIWNLDSNKNSFHRVQKVFQTASKWTVLILASTVGLCEDLEPPPNKNHLDLDLPQGHSKSKF